MAKIWGLIDYHISKAGNGMWYTSVLMHNQTPPGDHSPTDSGIEGESETKQDAIDAATEKALSAVNKGLTRTAAVFVEGDEVLFLAQGKKWVK